MRERHEDAAGGFVRLWSEMFRLWIDFMGPLVPQGLGAVACEPYSRQERVSPWDEPGGHSPPRQEWVRVMFDVSSPKRVEVTLDLDPSVRIDRLAVQDLRVLGAVKAEPIPGPKLERVDEHITVHLQVPPNQPPGTYLSMIIDPERAEQWGTLRVVVRD